MPNLKAIRKRIAGVKSTQQLTRAMKLVAAAKLRRAQEAAVSLRAYDDSLLTVIRDVARMEEDFSHPLLDDRQPKRVLLVTYSSDRGLCGSFNINVVRATEQFILMQREAGVEVDVAVIGKKGNEAITRRGFPVKFFYRDMFMDISYQRISRIGGELANAYRDGTYDGLFVLYNWFRSPLVQKVTLTKVLPVDVTAQAETDSKFGHIFEPGRKDVLDRLFPLYVNMELYHAVLESVASEMGARMTAMDNATKNATDVIQKLTLEYNKARQAAITKELVDIVGGAEAIK